MDRRTWALVALLLASTGLVAGCGDDSPEVTVERITSKSVNTECVATVRALEMGVELAHASTARYPTTIGDLVRDGFVRPNDAVSAATGTTFSQTSSAGTYVVTMTRDADGVPTINGTVDGSPC